MSLKLFRERTPCTLLGAMDLGVAAVTNVEYVITKDIVFDKIMTDV
jgi:hypothetical protein